VPSSSQGCLLFDWGDTLMRDFKQFTGPMQAWPRLEAVPGAVETLALLHSSWTIALATNAADSDEAAIRAALRRVGLDAWIDRIYCFANVGFRKPDPAFFRYILADLGLDPRRVCMVGDNFALDVLGANACGLRAVWFNPGSLEEHRSALHRTIHHFRLLPDVLKDFE
jgi:HAD superfamily hydrolase (TIGR01662 family)